MKAQRQKTRLEINMNELGYHLETSGGGLMWYVKPMKGGWFSAITLEDGCDVPTSYGDSILVGMYDPYGNDVENIHFNKLSNLIRILSESNYILHP